MGEFHVELLTAGALLLLGLATDALGRLTRLPRVTLLILFGILIGPPVLDLLPVNVERWHQLFTEIALVMVGFLLGGKLTARNLRRSGRDILVISLAVVVSSAGAVILGLWLIGVPLELALLLGGIAPATAPAAITSVVDELGARGRFTDTLLGIVAIDDAWGLIAFSVLLALAQGLTGDASGAQALATGAWEVGGALLVGAAIGVPAALLTGRIGEGEPLLTEALGVVLLAAGLALWLEVSFILTAMFAGAVVANLARHHRRPFHEIEHIDWPFMVLFFVLAGASLDVEALAAGGLMAAAYVGLRAAGRVAGSWLGGRFSGVPAEHRRWMGPALMPQAGVALGLALMGASAFPEHQSTLISVVIGSTVVFELTGPVLTRLALRRVGEA
jgi:Kef-type K+ transport system membrane component KefB